MMMSNFIPITRERFEGSQSECALWESINSTKRFSHRKIAREKCIGLHVFFFLSFFNYIYVID